MILKQISSSLIITDNNQAPWYQLFTFHGLKKILFYNFIHFVKNKLFIRYPFHYLFLSHVFTWNCHQVLSQQILQLVKSAIFNATVAWTITIVLGSRVNNCRWRGDSEEAFGNTARKLPCLSPSYHWARRDKSHHTLNTESIFKRWMWMGYRMTPDTRLGECNKWTISWARHVPPGAV